jgi:hypothetical protein
MRQETDVRTKNTDVSKVVFHPLKQKLPNLKLKTRPEQLLGCLTLDTPQLHCLSLVTLYGFEVMDRQATLQMFGRAGI